MIGRWTPIYKVVSVHNGRLVSLFWELLPPYLGVEYKPSEVSVPRPLLDNGLLFGLENLAAVREFLECWVAPKFASRARIWHAEALGVERLDVARTLTHPVAPPPNYELDSYADFWRRYSADPEALHAYSKHVSPTARGTVGCKAIMLQTEYGRY